MWSRAVAIIFWLLASCVLSNGQSLGSSCSIASFETEPAATVNACTTVLNERRLSDAERVDALKIRARSLHRLGRLDDAISDYEAALKLNSDDPELHLRRGWTAYDKGDFQLVLKQAAEALQLKPGYAAAYDLIGATLANTAVRRFPEAMAAYQQALRLDPNDPSISYHLFQMQDDWGQPEDGIKAADTVLQLPMASITKPLSVTYYGKKTSYRTATILERGRLFAVLGKLDAAKNDYDEAVQEDPGALTYAWRATFLLERLQPAASMEFDAIHADLKKSLAADDTYWFAHGVAGRTDFYEKNFQTAAAEFSRAIELYPINGTMRWWHAMTLRELGHSDQAAAEAVAAFRVDPGFMLTKVPVLQKYGFVQSLNPNRDPRPALYDAAQACMLDQRCS